MTSPTLAAQLDAMLERYPEARWHQWEAISRGNVVEGAPLAYGQPVDIVPKLDAADVVVAIDSDLLSSAPGHLRFARDFASRRNPTRTQKMNRLYAIETDSDADWVRSRTIALSPGQTNCTKLSEPWPPVS